MFLMCNPIWMLCFIVYVSGFNMLSHKDVFFSIVCVFLMCNSIGMLCFIVCVNGFNVLSHMDVFHCMCECF